jgi:hypothetical protein
MPDDSPRAKQVVSHAILGAAISFTGFWLADITGMIVPSLWHAAAEKWMLIVVACGHCSVGAALTGLIFDSSED